MENFVDILKDLITDTNKSINQIGRESGVAGTLLSRYLRGIYPSIDFAVKIAKYFHCTLDYLFGIDDNYKHVNIAGYDMTQFVDRYDKVLVLNNTSNWKLSKQTNCSEASYRHWQNGHYPFLPRLISIAENLTCSLDYLVGVKFE